jgi:hypothetical protein
MIIKQKNRGSILGAAFLACLVVSPVVSQTGANTHGIAPNAPPSEPAAKITIESPTVDGLARGVAVVHYRSQNLRIAPLFGPAALSLSPRVGHLHVNVDDAPWVWAHTNQEPVTVVGLETGRHKVRLQLMTANHQWLDESAVTFNLPDTRAVPEVATHNAKAAVQSSRGIQAIRMIIDSPLPEPLARGVILIRHRTENLGFTAAHIRVRVDDTPWHWTDKPESPVIVQGLAPGRHKILIELADSSDQLIDQGTVEVLIPAPKSQTEAPRK